MRVVSLPQPAATLTVTRHPSPAMWGPIHDTHPEFDPMVSRWVTFDYPCPSEVVGQRIAIHATKKAERCFVVGDVVMFTQPPGLVLPDGLLPEEDLPLGVVVGSAIVEASYPIVDGSKWLDMEAERIEVLGDSIWSRVGREKPVDITDQLPYSDWLPGRFAWLLADAAPCQERCPWCWGRGGNPGSLGEECPCCHWAGRCGPVSWVSSGGRLPEWQPT